MYETQNNVTLKKLSLNDVFSLSLSIPDYQRIYCWEDKQVNELWCDLMEMPNEKYHLGAIIFHKNGSEYNIVDGQQRLVTLTILLSAFGYDEEKMPLLGQKFLSQDARDHIAYAKHIINLKKQEIKDDKAFIKKITDNLVFTVLILNAENLDLAYTFFSNQNAKGVPLSDYDLLKAHHLRHIILASEQEHLAKQWNKITEKNEEYGVLSKTLGTHLYRLRKWMRKHDFDERTRLRVRDEFSAAPIMDGIPPFGEKFNFYEKIQGGSHFFAYVNHFIYQYEMFNKTRQVELLTGNVVGETHWCYESAIETLLFGYFIKFGNQYLSEALFCIASVMAQHRYERLSTNLPSVLYYAKESELVMMIDQATSPTFFFAEALSKITVTWKNLSDEEKEKRPIRKRFYERLETLFKSLEDFTDKTIINKKEQEYGK